MALYTTFQIIILKTNISIIIHSSKLQTIINTTNHISNYFSRNLKTHYWWHLANLENTERLAVIITNRLMWFNRIIPLYWTIGMCYPVFRTLYRNSQHILTKVSIVTLHTKSNQPIFINSQHNSYINVAWLCYLIPKCSFFVFFLVNLLWRFKTMVYFCTEITKWNGNLTFYLFMLQ